MERTMTQAWEDALEKWISSLPVVHLEERTVTDWTDIPQEKWDEIRVLLKG